MDIPEGAEFSQMPRLLGFGRIVAPACFGSLRDRWNLREWYVTLRLFGYRLFVASGLYSPKRRGYRYWILRDA